MVLQSSDRRLVSQFTNSKGLHTFDLRKGVKQLDYYDLHDYQMSDFDVGTEGLIDYAFSVAATEKYRYDVRPIDLRKPIN